MSYHVRTYKGGGADYDPRQQTYAEFHCDACGKNEDVVITGREHNFRFNDTRLCPHCNSHGKNDRCITIKKQIEELTSSKDNIEITIEELTRELDTLKETSEEVK